MRAEERANQIAYNLAKNSPEGAVELRDWLVNVLVVNFREVEAREREACAKIAEQTLPEGVSDWGKGYLRAARIIASDIRARGGWEVSNELSVWIFVSQGSIACAGIVGAFMTPNSALAVVITILSMIVFMNAILIVSD